MFLREKTPGIRSRDFYKNSRRNSAITLGGIQERSYGQILRNPENLLQEFQEELLEEWYKVLLKQILDESQKDFLEECQIFEEFQK